MRPSPWLREILTLDPERDAQRIVHIDTVYEFPFDTTRSLEFALFRTFGSPAVSRLLDETQEFATRSQRRYNDTDLILSTITEIPPTYEEFEQYNVEYERTNFRFTESNARVARASRDMFLAWFPGTPKGLGAHAIAALMDDRLRESIGFPRPPRALARAVERASAPAREC